MSTVSHPPAEEPTSSAQLKLSVQPTGIEASLSATGPRVSALISSVVGLSAAPLIVYLGQPRLGTGWTITLTLAELLVSLAMVTLFVTNDSKAQRLTDRNELQLDKARCRLRDKEPNANG